ncbi:hypothetical protein MTR72_24915 [Bradyrhizobium sp. ISRA442]|uniref:hypothetical protein n=1 Tax=Bradyrhizobium sp. ISRA442 TaxID=2866197 RepID=UPI00311B2D0E
MNLNRNRLALEVCAGFSVAAAAWIVNTQLGQILPYVDCQHQARYSAAASFAGAIAACAAGALSWRAVRRSSTAEPLPPVLSFLGAMSALSVSIFAFALLMQGMASLVLSGCER